MDIVLLKMKTLTKCNVLLAVLGLRGCAFSLAAVLGLLVEVASLVEKPGNGLVVVAIGPTGFSSFGSGPPGHRPSICGARGSAAP